MYIDSYPSPSGTHIMFLLRSVEDRTRLLEIFTSLADRRVSQFAFRRTEWVELSTACPPIILKLVEGQASRQIRAEEGAPDGNVFTWSRHSDGWRECAEKVESLVKSSHQYMGDGVVQVEVSFLENLQRQ
jgi:hypothetical protein